MKELSKFKIAQKRNYFKFVITGIPKPVDFAVLTPKEQILWQELLEKRKELISGFDEGSKQFGLKLHPKCWCGKRMRKTSCGDDDCQFNGKSLKDLLIQKNERTKSK